ncbi:FAD-binding and (Fe-S)-binding domain-containing protein [Bacteroides sp.]|uniref:FAD-binding and (Fe-S)-binding domain-containing protein n=1 Tax=Bacteroides sp. TaxID=29523 RepID=UPI001B616C74|nr:FAD-binding and (Fe-S)-binding domain-containing protein [Bacteroides sp.]MBP6065567.1 FAD-binding oxidoreductase [Bacteroides sp.]MBP6067806.1 FAD-binding oxidoreductase [Bacteroides sp.]MBP6936291.1 FAD-binding oxidoreductase [Bacteroides sp.]MBP8621599.1 FAD-binding oxidoreductase [Bacteroides sp.]MBP9507769.1 FAD-binding oxidoreductase [Bacteroides sp.]
MEKENRYSAFLEKIQRFVPQERIYTDELRRLAWGTDAGFYRLVPQIVIRSENEEEVSKLLRIADRYELPVTFRAAGTSLSGQAISDSILIVAGKHWEQYSISPDHERITLQPGIVGQRVNEILAPYQRKFAPDPASVKSAMVGGIVMNNASGMNCGTHANSDRMLLSARLILPDGTILDTGSATSRAQFAASHASFLSTIEALRSRILTDEALVARIRYKYAIKNVMGINLLPFILFEDPFDIIAHLLVGSEGTLAFLSEVTMKTEYDYPHKASAMLYFYDIKEACRAVVAMKGLVDADGTPIVFGAELLDHKSLASVNDTTGEGLTAVLTETKARTAEELQRRIRSITTMLTQFNTYLSPYFTDKVEEYSRYWAIRSGIFPSVGGTRQPGTTCLIEDVAFHINDLPEATAALQALIASHGYDDACIYGHALEGNYHFIINQSFSTESEVQRYASLMKDVITLVVDKYNGSLKAEHGTGRNMAPFVRYEWGDTAYQLMKEIKQLFDPKGLLNPGVIFNDDPLCYIKNFKPLPLAHPIVDKCIECGFCEVNCLTCGFTLSSRQRIVVQREIARLRQEGNHPEQLAKLEKQYRYPGNETCAGDGLCALSCPMGINTGDLTHILREATFPQGSLAYALGDFAANHFAGIKHTIRPVLTLANTAHGVLGTKSMTCITKGMHRIVGLPQWTPAMPKAYQVNEKQLNREQAPLQSTQPIDSSSTTPEPLKVVYFPSCINQTMGLPRKSPTEQPLVNKIMSLLHKAGYEVIFPKEMDNLCCGTIWESKGMPVIADRKAAELGKALWEASEQGRYPVLCDQSPCLHRMRETIKQMKLYEPAEFITIFLVDKLVFKPIDRPVALHVTCSMRHMGLADTIIALAKRCSTQVFVPAEVGCCGFAGDKGFTHPEVNEYALRKLRPQIETTKIGIGYSNSRTCEIGLTTHAGIPYVSIAYLVDECTTFNNLLQQ